MKRVAITAGMIALLLPMMPGVAKDRTSGESASPQTDLSINDLIGSWCGDGSDYTFSSTRLVVVLHNGKTPKHGNQLKIRKVEANAEMISVFWEPDKPGNSTDFQFSADKTQLIQVSQSKGDKGPRRVFRRC